eukprot:scaffold975_cov63-Phaeocystis_antarctica.AAC.18
MQVGELQARADDAQAHVSQLASSVPQANPAALTLALTPTLTFTLTPTLTLTPPMPQATKPLLRQIAALQAQQQQMQTAWRESEAGLQARLAPAAIARLAAADSAAAAAAQRERTMRDEAAAGAAR